MALSPLIFNLDHGSVSFHIPIDAVRQLKAELETLIANLKVITLAHQGGSKQTKPQPSMEYCHVGEVFLEVFCNPNIWSTPFAAKVLLTVRDSQIKLTTEAELTRLIEDVDRYLDNI